MRWIEQLWHVSMESLRRVCVSVFSLRLPSIMLPFLEGKKTNPEHKRGLGHAESLLQSLLIQAPVVTPYTASSPHSIMTTRHFRHDTTLSCLLLDADSDAVALHDGNLTEELSHAAAICGRDTTPAKQT